MPATLREAVARVSPEDEPLIWAASDLSPEGSYGAQWIAATSERVLVFSPDGGAEPELAVDLPLAEVTDVEIEGLVGGAALRAVMGGRKAALITFSNALMKRFGVVRGQLEALVKGRPATCAPLVYLGSASISASTSSIGRARPAR